MGDSEFVGGGSVDWVVRHSDGERGNGWPGGGDGKDKDPKKNNAMFVVTVTNNQGNIVSPLMFPVKGTTIRIVWADPAIQTSAMAAKTAKAPKARAKRVKAAK